MSSFRPSRHAVAAAVSFVLCALPLRAQPVPAGSAPGRVQAWTRNTFPSPAHKAHPELFPPGQGADRGEWLTCFGVSPVNPDFMLFTFDLGPASYADDGKYFRPAEMPSEKGGRTVAFHPADGRVGYILFYQFGSVPTSGGNDGIWRTEDTGKTWRQIYSVPTGSDEAGGWPQGKNLILVDPHRARARHIYFASYQRGLVRSTDNGATWQVAAFNQRSIKSIAAGVAPDGSTIIYVIVGDEMPIQKPGQYTKPVANKRHMAGALWRLMVTADGSFTRTKLPLGFDDVADVEIDPTDASRGFLIREPTADRRGGRRLYRFDAAGDSPATLLRDAGSAAGTTWADLPPLPQEIMPGDGGRTWTSLHGPDFPGIPGYLTGASLAVSAAGTLFVDGYMGLYSLPCPPDRS